MTSKKLARFGEIFILTLSSFFLIILAFSSIFIRARILLNNSEQGIFEKNSLFILLFLLFFITIIFFAKMILKKFSEIKIFLFFSILYLILGIYLALNVDSLLRHDALAVLSGAISFNEGDFSSLNPGSYLGMYPHQLGLVSFERIFLAIIPSARILFIINLFSILLINFFQWKTFSFVNEGDSLVTKYVIMMSFLFLPQLFFILFVYGLIPGLLFLYASVYFMVKFLKKQTLPYFVGNILFITTACAIRNNFVIAAIAMMLVYLLYFFKQKNKVFFIIAFLIIISPVVFNKAVTTYYELISGVKIDSAMPKTAYLAMGLQDNPNVVSFPGWYNGYHQQLFREYQGDVSQVEEQAEINLSERINYLRLHPAYTLKFFSKKLLSSWVDPTFQSIWSGPLESNQQFTHTSLLRSIYNGKTAYNVLAIFMNVYQVLIFFLAFYKIVISLIHKKDVDSLILFCLLYFLGGIFFHLFWETKSQYIYPYAFLLIPIACSGIPSHKKMRHQKSKK